MRLKSIIQRAAFLLLLSSSSALAQSADMPDAAPESASAGVARSIAVDASGRCDTAMSMLASARRMGGQGYATILRMFSDTVSVHALLDSHGFPSKPSRTYMVRATMRICQENGALTVDQAAVIAREGMDKIIASALSEAQGGGQ